MKKKILAIVMIATMSLSLAACGKTETDSKKENLTSTPAVESTSKEDVVEATTTPEVTETPETTETTEAVETTPEVEVKAPATYTATAVSTGEIMTRYLIANDTDEPLTLELSWGRFVLDAGATTYYCVENSRNVSDYLHVVDADANFLTGTLKVAEIEPGVDGERKYLSDSDVRNMIDGNYSLLYAILYAGDEVLDTVVEVNPNFIDIGNFSDITDRVSEITKVEIGYVAY